MGAEYTRVPGGKALMEKMKHLAKVESWRAKGHPKQLANLEYMAASVHKNQMVQ